MNYYELKGHHVSEANMQAWKAYRLARGKITYVTATKNVQSELQSIIIYPNPAHDIIHIRTMDDIKISSVIITDVTGRKVKEINLTSADNTGHDHIEIKDIRSEITPGMYILSISTSQGIVNKKVIIE